MNNRKQHPRKTVAYVRVSTDDQAEHGVSLDAQKARIAAYCIAMEWQVSEYIEDAGLSAKSLKRPGMSQILGGIRKGEIERVIITKLDRATRSVKDLQTLLELCQKYDVALVSLGESLDTSSAAGRLVVNMLGAVLQWEREAIAERTATALAHKRSKRQVYTGSIPFGYVREGDRLIVDMVQQHALKRMRELEAAGASLRTIASDLEAQGIPSRNGGKWHAASVRSVLNSKMALA